MAGQVRLRCTELKLVLRLPWWPTDVSRTLSARNVSELERPDRRPLAVPTSLTADEWSIGYTVREVDYHASVAGHITILERLARTKLPVQLLLADQSEGLFRVEAPTVTVLAWTEAGEPSVADVALTLARASDAEVNVGPVRRVKGRAKNMVRRG